MFFYFHEQYNFWNDTLFKNFEERIELYKVVGLCYNYKANNILVIMNNGDHFAILLIPCFWVLFMYSWETVAIVFPSCCCN